MKRPFRLAAQLLRVTVWLGCHVSTNPSFSLSLETAETHSHYMIMHPASVLSLQDAEQYTL